MTTKKFLVEFTIGLFVFVALSQLGLIKVTIFPEPPEAACASVKKPSQHRE